MLALYLYKYRFSSVGRCVLGFLYYVVVVKVGRYRDFIVFVLLHRFRRHGPLFFRFFCHVFWFHGFLFVVGELLRYNGVFSGLVYVLLYQVGVALYKAYVVNYRQPRGVFSRGLCVFASFRLRYTIYVYFLMGLVNVRVRRCGKGGQGGRDGHGHCGSYDGYVLRLHSCLRFSMGLFCVFSSFRFLYSFLCSTLGCLFCRAPFFLPLRYFYQGCTGFVFFRARGFPLIYPLYVPVG